MQEDWYVVHGRFVGDLETQASLRDAHLEYIAELMDTGLLAAGPLDGGDERLRIMRAPSREVVEEALARDPWVEAGQVEARVLRWQLGDDARARLDAGLR
jgi:uncharacterized protein YciI